MGWRDHVSPKRAWIEALITTLFFYLMGLGATILTFTDTFYDWSKADFIQFEGTLRSKPYFKKQNKAATNLEFILNEAPDFIFSINEDDYSVLKAKSKIAKLKPNDTVYVLIEKKQYDIKIDHKPAKFWQGTLYWKNISVYEILTENKPPSFNRVLRELKNDNQYYPFIALICFIGGTLFCRYELKKYKQKQ